MTKFLMTLTYVGQSGQKSYWENVVEELRLKGALILDVQFKVGEIGQPPQIVNIVTITYDAPREIKLDKSE
jgi:hypothetical protein